MEKSKKSKIVFSTVAVIVLVALAVVGFFVYKSKSPYKKKSKTDFAMGSVISVQTFNSKYDENVEQRVIDCIKDHDKFLSNKIESSTISMLNEGTTVTLDNFTYDALVMSKKIYKKTDGKAALTVGALSKLWDFDSGKNVVPEKEDIEKVLKTVNDDNLRFNERQTSVKNGSILDLGSIGKGFACDKAARVLNESDVENAVVAVGGSIYAKGYTAPGRKIRVGIRNPFGNENEYLGYISTDNAFISTSGNYEKVFEKDGKKYHHLLDCTTGYPVEGDLISVTVICDNGAKSDALSTACFVMGYGEKTLSLLADEDAEAIFVFEDKSVIITKKLNSSFTLTDNSFTVTKV